MFPGILNAMEYSKRDYIKYMNKKIKDGCQNIFFATFAIHICNFTDLSVSATIRHPLIFFGTCAIIQHQGSLSPVTSQSANQQPAIYKLH